MRGPIERAAAPSVIAIKSWMSASFHSADKKSGVIKVRVSPIEAVTMEVASQIDGVIRIKDNDRGA